VLLHSLLVILSSRNVSVKIIRQTAQLVNNLTVDLTSLKRAEPLLLPCKNCWT